jgi:hypothetical protein
MGGEVLAVAFVFLALVVGFLGSVVLFGLSLTASSRPLALCVFLAACLLAVFLSSIDGHTQDVLWGHLIVWYSLGVILFGATAYAIKRLLNALRPNNRWRGP